MANKLLSLLQKVGNASPERAINVTVRSQQQHNTNPDEGKHSDREVWGQ